MPRGDGVFLGGFAVLAFDINLAQALADFAVANHAIDFADDGGILGLAGFEEFNDARQTAGDVLGLGGFARDLREHVAGLNFVAIGPSSERETASGTSCGSAGGIADQDGGLMFFVARRKRNDELRQTGDFIHLFLDGDAGLQVVKLHGCPPVSVRIEKVNGSHSARICPLVTGCRLRHARRAP